MEIVSLLMDNYELIDWRRFLLSAALPWPFPSLSQLLVVLQRFKAADTGNTGYVNEEQYLQVSTYAHKLGHYTINSGQSDLKQNANCLTVFVK